MDGKFLGVLIKRIPGLCFRNVNVGQGHKPLTQRDQSAGHCDKTCFGRDDKLNLEKLGDWWDDQRHVWEGVADGGLESVQG